MPQYRAITRKHLEQLPQLERLGPEFRRDMMAVSAVLPFRTNQYVVDHLIDWNAVPDDPVFQLTFPQPRMLRTDELARVRSLLELGANTADIDAAVRAIHSDLNPHPAGQRELNVPRLGERPVPGLQHKYRETVLFFPAQGQTCHAYCTYCFRWAQFVKDADLRFASSDVGSLVAYLRQHREVRSVLITGGDPMVMRTSVLRRIVEPLLAPDLEHIESIRIGTKAPAFWPYRFTHGPEADSLMDLIETVERAGKQLAVMAHYSHPRELSTEVAQQAIRRLRSAGAAVRCQAPLVAHVNDDADTWAELWRLQVRLGAVPYYLFVERDTGPRDYFAVPLARALRIFNDAYRSLSGLGRTVRGPSMSTTPGKILIDGVATIRGEKVFVLKFLQARKPEWVGRPFFAAYDESAIWLDDLRPAFGEEAFFYEREFERMLESRHSLRVLPSVPMHDQT